MVWLKFYYNAKVKMLNVVKHDCFVMGNSLFIAAEGDICPIKSQQANGSDNIPRL